MVQQIFAESELKADLDKKASDEGHDFDKELPLRILVQLKYWYKQKKSCWLKKRKV